MFQGLLHTGLKKHKYISMLPNCGGKHPLASESSRERVAPMRTTLELFV